jgi:hypothetical protein
LELRDVPQRFTTTSRVALIGNDWKTVNADVAALEDRGHVLVFEPTALEVHHQAAGWFWDQQIFLRRRRPCHRGHRPGPRDHPDRLRPGRQHRQHHPSAYSCSVLQGKILPSEEAIA